MKYLIVNADDLGMASEINEAIIEAHRNGIVTSTSIMANMPFFDEAVALLKNNPSLGVGIHLNILRGKPISPASEIRSLLKNGFYEFSGDAYKIFFRLFTKQLKLDEIRTEWRAQIETALNMGLHITHLDSEKHLHSLPSIMALLISLCKEFGIKKVRLVRELMNRNIKPPKRQFYKACFLNRLAKMTKDRLDKEEILYPDYFIGVQVSGSLDVPSIREVLSSLPDGITELMCHPGWEASYPYYEYGNYYTDAFRKIEFEALTSPETREILEKNDIRLINFEDL